MTGKLIVIEGACDGIGKTTQYNKLYDYLCEHNVKVVKHHFPSYNTYQASPVEHYLSGEYGSSSSLSPYFINSLYALDRAITWKEELENEYLSGHTILLDRYTTSSLIYQSSLIDDIKEKEDFIDYVIDFEYNKLGLQEPDGVIFLSAPFDLVTEIREKRENNEGVKKDIHESDLSFMHKVYDNALFIADYLDWDKIECSNESNMRSVDDIHHDVIKLVKKR